MPYYENVFIARQDVSSSQVESLADNLASIIEQNGGKVTKREHWGLKTLAYRIKKNRKGHYVLFNIDAPSAAVQEMERSMRYNEDVLRYLTVRVDELDEGPSPMMQSRGGRDRREGRRGAARDEGERKRAAGSDEEKERRPAKKAPSRKKAEPAEKSASKSSESDSESEGGES